MCFDRGFSTALKDEETAMLGLCKDGKCSSVCKTPPAFRASHKTL